LFDPTQAYDIYVVARKANHGETASGAAAWPSAAPAGVTGLTGSDNDATTGVDGRDFTANWTPSSSTDVIRQYIYILPDGQSLNPAAPTVVPPPMHLIISGLLTPAVVVDQPVDYVADNSTGSWTGTSAITKDSRGNLLAAGNYGIWIGAVSDDLRMTVSESAAFAVADP